MMNPYIEKLRLKYDPFDDVFQRDDFFGGGNRENLVLKILDRERKDISLDAIIGPPQSGKTRLAFRLCERSRGNASPVLISVDLFTTALHLLREILRELELDPPGDLAQGLECLSEYAVERARSGKSILLVIDEAHELGSDCMRLVERLLANRWSAIHLALLGEEQLAEMLHARLRDRHRAKLAMHELPTFNRVEIAEYIHLKLSRAGYSRKLPLSSQAGLDLLQRSEGMPGPINALTAAMLNSDEFPGIGRGQGRRREGQPRPVRPEIRYFSLALALSLALAAVVFWPVDSPELSASTDEQRSEQQRFSVPVPAAAATAVNTGNAGLLAAAAPQRAVADPAREDAEASPGLTEFELLLLNTPSDNFTVQVLGSTSEEGVRDFIAAARLGEIHGYYETRHDREPWFVVVDGMYPDWETAMEARARLAESFDDSPWVRRMSNVHSEIISSGKQRDP